MTSDWTIEAWFFIPDTIGTSEIHLVETYSSPNTGGFVLRLTNLRLRALQMVGSTSFTDLKASEIIPLHQWVHVAATMDQTNDLLKLYVNGVEVGSKASAINTSNLNSKLYIGARGDDQDVNNNYSMDEVRIWGVAKSALEIQNGMYACLEGNEMNLLAYYDFEGINSAVVQDKSSNNNNGTIANYAATSLTDGVYSCGNITSVNNTQLVNEEATIVRAYDLRGKEVSPITRGELIIIQYSDGTRVKTFID